MDRITIEVGTTWELTLEGLSERGAVIPLPDNYKDGTVVFRIDTPPVQPDENPVAVLVKDHWLWTGEHSAPVINPAIVRAETVGIATVRVSASVGDRPSPLADIYAFEVEVVPVVFKGVRVVLGKQIA